MRAASIRKGGEPGLTELCGSAELYKTSARLASCAGLAASVAAMGLLMPGAAQSQSALPTDVAAPANAVQEVVVTANKVAEPLNRVPESIGVLTADELTRNGTQDLQGIINHVPGLSADIEGAPGTGFVAVRGISPSGGNSTTTGMYMDDVSINFGNFGFAGAFEPALYDLDRVEVLRGPQGTLYGAESFGGTIRYVARQPGLNTVEGSVSGNLYGQNAAAPGGGATAAFSTPLVPGELALRVAAYYQYDGGFINHENAGGEISRRNTNAQQVEAFRATLLWQPVEALRISPRVDYQLTRNDDTWTFDGNAGGFTTPRLLNEPLRDTFTLGAVDAVYTFGSHELTSVSSYVDRRIERIQDYTIYDMGYIGPVVAAYFDPDNLTDAAQVLPNLADAAHHLNTNRQWGQELRLASHFDAIGLQTLLGVYYNHEVRGHVSAEDAMGLGAYTMSHFGVSANDALDAAFGLPAGSADLGDVVYGENTTLTFNRRAIYGEASWEPGVLPGLKITAGVRYSRISYTDLGYLDGFFADGLEPVNQQFSETQTAPKYRIAYQATPNQLYYLSAAKGFRLGGPNTALPSSCIPEEQASGLTPTDSYRTDSIWSYEAGAKLGLLERRLQLNVSAYHIAWTNIAEEIDFPVCGFGYTANVGTAHSNGGDLSIQVRPWTGFDASIGVAYTDAEFEKAVPLAGIAVGQQIPYSPPWTASVDMGQEWKLGDGSLYARFNATYTDVSQQYLVVSGTHFTRPAYTTAGMNLGYRTATSADISLFIRNLTNAEPFLSQDNGLGYYNVFSLRPRTIGIQVSQAF